MDVDCAGEVEMAKAEADDDVVVADDAGPWRGLVAGGGVVGPGGEGGVRVEEGGFEEEEGV